jgi:Tol biopolymer transport system component
MDSNGSNQIRLISNDFNDELPWFSPDGARLAFVSDRDESLEIYVRKTDLSIQHLTNKAATDYIPSWSPDGEKSFSIRPKRTPTDLGHGIGWDERAYTHHQLPWKRY